MAASGVHESMHVLPCVSSALLSVYGMLYHILEPYLFLFISESPRGRRKNPNLDPIPNPFRAFETELGING